MTFSFRAIIIRQFLDSHFSQTQLSPRIYIEGYFINLTNMFGAPTVFHTLFWALGIYHLVRQILATWN